MNKFIWYYNFGSLLVGIAEDGKGICGIYVVKHKQILDVVMCSALESETTLIKYAAVQLKEYFAGERKIFDFPLSIYGTEFQNRVWTELCKIPYGETRTYGEIAAAIGNPKASRAVGLANNRNKLMIVIPCHRVIGANGSLTGYRGGVDVKSFLLNLEQHSKN